ncbi:MAG TPA: hypothetical protein VF081_02890 [Solirubrobacterales bacterium]
MEVVLIVLGAVIGAASTGGVQAWDARRSRRLRRMVAARVVQGDLYITEAMLEIVLKYKAWPDRLDLDSPISTWRQFRADFAVGVEAWEWAKVDSFYSSLHRTSLMVRAGQPCTDGDLAVAEELLEAARAARNVVTPYAVPGEGERREVIEQLAGSTHALEGRGLPSDSA